MCTQSADANELRLGGLRSATSQLSQALEGKKNEVMG
jgi:hypothetical protein